MSPCHAHKRLRCAVCESLPFSAWEWAGLILKQPLPLVLTEDEIKAAVTMYLQAQGYTVSALGMVIGTHLASRTVTLTAEARVTEK